MPLNTASILFSHKINITQWKSSAGEDFSAVEWRHHPNNRSTLRETDLVAATDLLMGHVWYHHTAKSWRRRWLGLSNLMFPAKTGRCICHLTSTGTGVAGLSMLQEVSFVIFVSFNIFRHCNRPVVIANFNYEVICKAVLDSDIAIQPKRSGSLRNFLSFVKILGHWIEGNWTEQRFDFHRSRLHQFIAIRL